MAVVVVIVVLASLTELALTSVVSSALALSDLGLVAELLPSSLTSFLRFVMYAAPPAVVGADEVKLEEGRLFFWCGERTVPVVCLCLLSCDVSQCTKLNIRSGQRCCLGSSG